MQYVKYRGKKDRGRKDLKYVRKKNIRHYLVSLRKGVNALYDNALLFFFANMLSSKKVTSLECSFLGELGPAPHSSS
jgi:hypothetical protein